MSERVHLSHPTKFDRAVPLALCEFSSFEICCLGIRREEGEAENHEVCVEKITLESKLTTQTIGQCRLDFPVLLYYYGKTFRKTINMSGIIILQYRYGLRGDIPIPIVQVPALLEIE